MFVVQVLLDDKLFTTPIEEYRPEGREQVIRAYACCKGECDSALKIKYQKPNSIDYWFELCDFTIPSTFIVSVLNLLEMIDGTFSFSSTEAATKVAEFLMSVFHTVARELTDEEEAHVSLRIP